MIFVASPARTVADAGHRLDHYRVDLSVTGLPTGVTATFSPAQPRLSGTRFALD